MFVREGVGAPVPKGAVAWKQHMLNLENWRLGVRVSVEVGRVLAVN